MQACKLLGFIVSIFMLSGCAGIVSKYQSLPPTEAITAFAKEHDPKSHIVQNGPTTTVLFFAPKALTKTYKNAEFYCSRNHGRVENWPYEIWSFLCVDRTEGSVIFAVKTGANGKIEILERTTENNYSYSSLLRKMGYQSMSELIEEQQRDQRAAQERLIQSRLREREKVAFVGAKVCQTQQFGSASTPFIIYVGTVEQVAGEKLKIFVERAFFPNAPSLSPGGFRQQYNWVNIWDVEACNH